SVSGCRGRCAGFLPRNSPGNAKGCSLRGLSATHDPFLGEQRGDPIRIVRRVEASARDEARGQLTRQLGVIRVLAQRVPTASVARELEPPQCRLDVRRTDVGTVALDDESERIAERLAYQAACKPLGFFRAVVNVVHESNARSCGRPDSQTQPR